LLIVGKVSYSSVLWLMRPTIKHALSELKKFEVYSIVERH